MKQAVTSIDQAKSDDQLLRLPIEYIRPGKYQPRTSFSEQDLEELAQSIEEEGIIQPLIVRKLNPMQYELIAGERRWRAAGIAGLYDVPCIVRELPDDKALRQALIENIQRKDLNPIEEAEGILRLVKEFSYTHEATAEAIGKSRSYVTNLLRYLSLPSNIQNWLVSGDLEAGHAKVLGGVPEDWRERIARECVIKKYSVRQLESLVTKRFHTQKKKANPSEDPNIKMLSERISRVTGCPTSIQHTQKGSGSVVLTYSNIEELEGLLRHLPLQDMDD